MTKLSEFVADAVKKSILERLTNAELVELIASRIAIGESGIVSEPVRQLARVVLVMVYSRTTDQALLMLEQLKTLPTIPRTTSQRLLPFLDA
jgi:hypothetical protein